MAQTPKRSIDSSLVVAVVSLLISLFTFVITFIVHDKAIVTISPLVVNAIQPTPQTWAFSISFNLAAVTPDNGAAVLTGVRLNLIHDQGAPTKTPICMRQGEERSLPEIAPGENSAVAAQREPVGVVKPGEALILPLSFDLLDGQWKGSSQGKGVLCVTVNMVDTLGEAFNQVIFVRSLDSYDWNINGGIPDYHYIINRNEEAATKPTTIFDETYFRFPF